MVFVLIWLLIRNEPSHIRYHLSTMESVGFVWFDGKINASIFFCFDYLQSFLSFGVLAWRDVTARCVYNNMKTAFSTFNEKISFFFCFLKISLWSKIVSSFYSGITVNLLLVILLLRFAVTSKKSFFFLFFLDFIVKINKRETGCESSIFGHQEKVLTSSF